MALRGLAHDPKGDFMSALLNTQTILILIFIFVVIPLLRLFKPQIKGWFGEFMVNLLLTRRLDQNMYKIVRDVMLPADDATTQIDHVVVSRFGIFVIETKNYQGWIFGSENDAQWTQQIFKKKSRFQNPLRQNYKHTSTLADLTGIPHDYFKSVVVFGGDATFKTELPANVIHAGRLIDYIRSQTNVIIKDEQVPEIVSAISEWAGTVSKDLKSQHVENLRKSKGPVSADADSPSCPKCGSTMVLRTRKKDAGQFWGCTSYPQCRGIREAA